ncbi:MAG: hypothetical protein KDB82_02575 [Planctomycetes bacterium]|nr:hypothetical protein [Planctomycetota bacterium]
MQRFALAIGLAVLACLFGCDKSGSGGGPTGTSSQQQATNSYASAPIPLLILDSELPRGEYGTAYSHQMTAIGGGGGYNWSILSATAPGMFNLSAAGVLTVTGMPQSTFWATIDFEVGDGSTTATRQLTFRANTPPPPPSYFAKGSMYVLNAGDEMSTIDAGHTLSRFQRAAQDIMRDIADQLWSPSFSTDHDNYAVIVAGNGAAGQLGTAIYTAQVSDKVQAINDLAAVTPGGEAPMYSAEQLAESVAFNMGLIELTLYSGGVFGSDSAAPGGQSDFSNVLAAFTTWLGSESFDTNAADYKPSGAHQQFMLNFVAINAGAYTTP